MVTNRLGRPTYLPTKEQRNAVLAMVAGGCEAKAMALVMGCSRTIFRRAYKDEMKVGVALVGARLKGSAVQKALQGDKQMLMFVLKTKYDWRETDRRQLLGKDDKPINFDALDDASLDHVIAALTASVIPQASPGGQAGADGDSDT